MHICKFWQETNFSRKFYRVEAANARGWGPSAHKYYVTPYDMYALQWPHTQHTARDRVRRWSILGSSHGVSQLSSCCRYSSLQVLVQWALQSSLSQHTTLVWCDQHLNLLSAQRRSDVTGTWNCSLLNTLHRSDVTGTWTCSLLTDYSLTHSLN